MGIYSKVILLIFGIGISLFGNTLFLNASNDDVIVTKQPVWEMSLNDTKNTYNWDYSQRERIWFCISEKKGNSSLPTKCVLSSYVEKECIHAKNKGSLWIWIEGLIFKSKRSLYCENQSVFGIFF
ncbi:MAG: hypothetical protein EOM19_00890 [Candidatus Moranbacteria bacterium]|nr:hypothetical protein [Candidatus Moranbacteria bacterium]